MLLKLAWRNIWRNKKRTWITIASIFFAVVLAFLMRSMQEGTYNMMVDNVAGFYSGHAQIQHKDYWEKRSLENSFAYKDTLRHLLADNAPSQLNHFVPRLESFALASSGKLSKGAMVLGIDPEKEKEVMDPQQHLVAGEYLEPGDKSILLSKGLADNINLEVGDTLILMGQGYHGVPADGKFPVKGIVDIPNPDLNKRLTFLSLNQAQYLFGCPNRLTGIALIAEESDNVAPLVKSIDNSIGDPYSVMSWQEMNPDLVQAIEADRGSGVLMLLILYIVIGFGIFGTVIMMTMERRREFAILIGIGMHRSRLALVTFLETLMIAFTGIALGFVGGLPIISYFYFNPIPLSGELAAVTKSFGLEPVIPFSLEQSVFTGQMFIVLVITILTSFYPVSKVLRMDVINQMKN